MKTSTNIKTFLLSLFFTLTLSSCEKHFDHAEQIEPLNKTSNELEEVRSDPSVENQTVTTETNKMLGEINSLDTQALDLSSENDELKKTIRALTDEFNKLKQEILDKK